MKAFIFGILLVAASLLMGQSKRPYNGGTPWQVKLTLLTSSPVAVSTLAGSPPPTSKDIWVCQGGPSSASASAADTVSFTSADGSNTSWNNIQPWPNAPGGAAAKAIFWQAGSTLACEWMPSGMTVSSTGTGVYFQASGVY